MLLDVIDDHASGFHALMRAEQIDDEPRTLELVFEVRRMDENQLVVLHREVDVLLKDVEFIARIAVQADFADTEDVGFREELGDHRKHIGGEGEIFGFLGVDAEPGKMRQEKLRGARGLILRELAKIVTKAINRAAIVASPEGGFADGLTPGRDHRLIVVGRAADHMAVGLDVAHGGK